ncbi:MAG: hypothetical protein AAGB06_06610 [Verrucomicrobiota bacterium]
MLLFVSFERKRGTLSDFTSDGCSLFPDRSLIMREDWCDCCYQHDIAYWQGGTEVQRLAADQALRACVFEKTQSQELADLMFEGVRFGGSPYFYNWYRWGYGWDFERKYGPLSEYEEAQVRLKLSKLSDTDLRSVCNQE